MPDVVAHGEELAVEQPVTVADAPTLLVIERAPLVDAQHDCVTLTVAAALAVARTVSLTTGDRDTTPLTDAVVEPEAEPLAAPETVLEAVAQSVLDSVFDGVADAHILTVLDTQEVPTGDTLNDGVSVGERDCETHMLCDPERDGVHESGVSLTVCDAVAHWDVLADVL